MRGNRSTAVTATGGGWKMERRWGGGSECFNVKAKDVSETDAGLCLGNGPWAALFAWFSVRRIEKKVKDEGG